MKVTLDLSNIFNAQKELDKYIYVKHNVTYKKVDEELHLALAVELSEFANEVRCFKFWSIKPMSDKAIVLEEFVDGIHFITSLSISYKVDPINFEIDYQLNLSKHDLTILLNNLFNKVGKIKDKVSIKNWYCDYLSLGMSLGFSFKDIFDAYMLKNKINHQRQDNNY